MAFRKQGCKQVGGSARGVFLEALRSGWSQSAAATVAGVSHSTGHRWANAEGVAADLRHRGVRYPVEAREAFWAAMTSGSAPSQASLIAGVSDNTGQIWVQQAGYVPRTQTLVAVVADELDLVPRVRAPLRFTDRCRLEERLREIASSPPAAGLVGLHRDTTRRDMSRAQTRSGHPAPAGHAAPQANRTRPN